MNEPRFQISDEDRAAPWGGPLNSEAAEALVKAEKVLGLKLDGTPRIVSLSPAEAFYREAGVAPHNIVAVAVARENRIIINRAEYLHTGSVERRRTLVHEFSHLIVGRQIPGGVPRWLDEGLAMIVADEHGFAYHVRLAVAATFGGLIPLDRLWESAATGEEAQTLAYAQSLSITRFFLSSVQGHDPEDPSRLVAKLADPAEGEHLRKLLHDSNYLFALETNWRKSLNSAWTWLAAFTGGGFFWTGLTFLFLFTYWRKKRLMEEKVRRWEEQEDFSEGRDYAMYREEDFVDDDEAEEYEIPGEEERWM